MLGYPHHLHVERATRTESDDLGGFVEGETRVVYDDRADVQDAGRSSVGGAQVTRDGGTVTEEGDATAFLPPEADADAFAVGDQAVITWPDGTDQAATVARVVRLDDKLMLSYD